MEIRREEKGKSIVLHVEGNLIGVAIVQLCKVIEGIQNSDYEHVLLDLGGVRHFDSRVAGGLIYSATILRKRKKKFSLIAASESLTELLAGCSLLEPLDVSASAPPNALRETPTKVTGH